MGELSDGPDSANVNVTLAERRPLAGKTFPCPVCGTGLEIRQSRKQKPYCVCDSCGIQIFFRGKTGIRRLQEILESERLVSGTESNSGSAVAVFNRLQQLRAQKKELEQKQGLIFCDEDLENAIRAVDNEIERMQGVLDKLAQNPRKRRTK